MLSRFSNHRRGARSLVTTAVIVALVTFAVVGGSSVSARSGGGVTRRSPKPTVVLVHGAFADASSWSGVIARLQRLGYPVLAPANPLRGVADDAAYMRSVLATIKGPIVLVGHSYGGFVITNAALGNPNVKALVYIAAYAPEKGETAVGINALAPGSKVAASLTIQTVPGPGGTQVQEASIAPSAFRDVFAADLPPAMTAVMAASQRPAALAAFTQPSGEPAWKSIPSWYMVAGRDNAIGTAVEQIMARRMGAHTVEVRTASHAVMVSHPDAVTRLILRAARATGVRELAKAVQAARARA